jgi:D-3-phosphoglycerate dehydrogenase / 2-oxoglutarate reductase
MIDIKNCRLLVTPTSFGKTDPSIRDALEAAVGEVVYNPLTRPLRSSELIPLLAGCDGYIAGLDEIDRAAIHSANRLRVISRYGVGVDNIDLDAARDRGIIITNTPGANAVSVAELTIAMLLALARSLISASGATRRGEWPRMSGLTMEEKTIGLLGLGAIGQQVARRLQCFDCRILASDPYSSTNFAARYNIQLLPTDEMARQADFLSVHIPLTNANRELINADFLRTMKPGSFLINTARGELVNEDDLTEALKSGHLRGAALDVFNAEPPPVDHPLLHMQQVIVTPHCGAHTDGAIRQMGRMSIHDCLAVLRGEEPHYPVI